jgi:hypothetical protein
MYMRESLSMLVMLIAMAWQNMDGVTRRPIGRRVHVLATV